MNAISGRLLAGAVVLVCVVLGAGISRAEDFTDQVSGYATLGAGDVFGGGASYGEVTGRVGLRAWTYVGVEGEFSTGLDRDRFVLQPPCHGQIPCPLLAILVNARLRDAEAVYAVGYLPLTEDADLFGRAGYGASHFTGGHSIGFDDHSFNYGVGGDYFFGSMSGIRIDFTRYDNLHGNWRFAGDGPNANVISGAYVIRF